MKKRRIGQYFFYLGALAFTWVLIGQIIQAAMTTETLVRVHGTIDSTAEARKKRWKSTSYDYELRLFLRNNPEYFRIMDIYKYEKFRDKIRHGDPVDIYIRPKWLVPLGLGYKNDVFQMSVRGETIFDLSEIKAYNLSILIIVAIAIAVFCYLGRYVNKNTHR